MLIKALEKEPGSLGKRGESELSTEYKVWKPLYLDFE
jgi:hypothetical protein